jgi:hypothetical protein
MPKFDKSMQLYTRCHGSPNSAQETSRSSAFSSRHQSQRPYGDALFVLSA